MAEIIVYSENTHLALELAAAAAVLAQNGTSVCMLCVNNQEQSAALAAKGLDVCSVKAGSINLSDNAAMSTVLQTAASKLGAKIVILASNRRGKELSGRLAEAWEAGCLTDVKAVQIENGSPVFNRNALGGATVAAQLITSEKKVVAISPRSFPAWDKTGTGRVDNMDISAAATIEVLEVKAKAADAVDIQAADKLIAVGQGVEDQEDLLMVDKVAQALGAALGCSKPVATDRKWFSEDRIIGLSGKICKPDLAIMLGVSGQVQFMVGIRESKTIVSINQDENADMNNNADYVLAADLKDVLPELAKMLD